ncbi:MAG TPA: hypothetical protein VJP88_03185 [Caulobacteraceae bacterium]|nr:hypothetical protein [Caulobacteraceae bacterium]
MLSDAALLDRAPDFISVGEFMKATPSTEGARRYLYLEASNEGRDQQAEVVMAKALAESAKFYERYGNVDIDHYTQIGAKLGIPDYLTYEIGRPIAVRQRDGVTFVKCELYSGIGDNVTSPMLEKANMVWDSVAKMRPAQRWYPSVGGAVLHKSLGVNANGERTVLIDRVRWQNIGLSKTPVNQHVPECAVIPMEVFAKSWGAAGLDITKALTAGYGTDTATFEGGQALREQSLDGAPGSRATSRDGIKSYFEFREKLAGAIRSGAVEMPNSTSMVAHAMNEFGLSQDEATEHVERFVRDLKNGLSRGRH